jgi:hypothetical protein
MAWSWSMNARSGPSSCWRWRVTSSLRRELLDRVLILGQVADGFERNVEGQQPEADSYCLLRSLLGGCDSIRDPVKRQTTITLASVSMALSSAQPTRVIEPAAKPASRPRVPSAAIQASDVQASQRA